MRAKSHLLLLTGGLVFLSGCAGTDAGIVAANPQNNVRANVGGDSYTYALVGTYKSTPSSLSVATTGTATQVYLSDLYGSQAAIQGTLTTMLNLASGNYTLIETEQVSPAGVTLGATDAGAVVAVTTGGFTKPTTLSGTTNITGTETLANGTTINLDYTVTGALNVTTTAGTFACWTATRTITYSDGYTSTDTIEFAPTIGGVVQEVIHNTYSNGFSYTGTSSLTAYSFGVPPPSGP